MKEGHQCRRFICRQDLSTSHTVVYVQEELTIPAAKNGWALQPIRATLLQDGLSRQFLSTGSRRDELKVEREAGTKWHNWCTGAEEMNRNIEVQQVRRNSRNRHLFRQLSHEVTRAIYDPPEGHVLFFAYHHQYKPHTLAGVGCCEKGQHSSNHSIMYLFIKSFYQKRGIGKSLLTSMEDYLLRDSSRNIEIEAAGKAVGFFEKHGYSLVGEPIKPPYSGSDLFRTLQKMEKVVSSTTQHEYQQFTYEDWNP